MGQGKKLPPDHVLFTLICPNSKVKITSTPYYVGRTLSHELSQVFEKVSLDQYEKDILCGRLARPLISNAVPSQKISGVFLLDLPIFAFTMSRKKLDLKLLVKNKYG